MAVAVDGGSAAICGSAYTVVILPNRGCWPQGSRLDS